MRVTVRFAEPHADDEMKSGCDALVENTAFNRSDR